MLAYELTTPHNTYGSKFSVTKSVYSEGIAIGFKAG